LPHGHYFTFIAAEIGTSVYELILFALMENETGPLRILVVDDDTLSRELLTLLLEHAGYRVDSVDSGDAAVQHLSGSEVSLPNVVLADLQMPGITGGTLALKLRDLCGPSTILLAMSGSTPHREAVREFNGFLLKPFTVEDFAAAIAEGGKAGAARQLESQDSALDPAVYEKLAGSMRKERLEQLYTLCLKDTEQRITQMRQAASHEDDAAYRKDAHAIKGGAGMVGAVELQALAASMEQKGMEANHIASLDQLKLACDRLRRILIARWAESRARDSEEGTRDECNNEK